MNKKEVLEKLKEYNLDHKKFIVIGSAALVLKGLKEVCHDIDIAVTKEYNDYLLENFECKFEKEINNQKVYFIDNTIIFSTHYYNDFKGEIIEKYLVQTPKEVLKLKESLNRPKDKGDIKLILNYLNSQNLNSLALAYIGDASYELYIRKFLTSQGNYKVNDLQKIAVNYVSAKAQSNFLDKLIENNLLSIEELEIVKRARNHKVLSHPKNTSIIVYKKATGLEALIGFLELNNKHRLNEIMKYIVGESLSTSPLKWL